MFKLDQDQIARRLAAVIERLDDGRLQDRYRLQERAMLMAIEQMEPASLGDVAKAVKRGAPAISRAVDTAVRDGLVDRRPDPDHRRRLQLRLTEEGRRHLEETAADHGPLAERISRLAPSELRAVERAIEIFEQMQLLEQMR